jgi:hypothetical protein
MVTALCRDAALLKQVGGAACLFRSFIDTKKAIAKNFFGAGEYHHQITSAKTPGWRKNL